MFAPVTVRNSIHGPEAYILILDLHMRLTAQVQPNKSSSKQCSRTTRNFDIVFWVSTLL